MAMAGACGLLHVFALHLSHSLAEQRLRELLTGQTINQCNDVQRTGRQVDQYQQ